MFCCYLGIGNKLEDLLLQQLVELHETLLSKRLRWPEAPARGRQGNLHNQSLHRHVPVPCKIGYLMRQEFISELVKNPRIECELCVSIISRESVFKCILARGLDINHLQDVALSCQEVNCAHVVDVRIVRVFDFELELYAPLFIKEQRLR